jgi:hypothetical protein
MVNWTKVQRFFKGGLDYFGFSTGIVSSTVQRCSFAGCWFIFFDNSGKAGVFWKQNAVG